MSKKLDMTKTETRRLYKAEIDKLYGDGEFTSATSTNFIIKPPPHRPWIHFGQDLINENGDTGSSSVSMASSKNIVVVGSPALENETGIAQVNY